MRVKQFLVTDSKEKDILCRLCAQVFILIFPFIARVTEQKVLEQEKKNLKYVALLRNQ